MRFALADAVVPAQAACRLAETSDAIKPILCDWLLTNDLKVGWLSNRLRSQPDVPPYPQFIRSTGAALMGAGALVMFINVVITPLLPRGAPHAETVASTAFVWRQSLSAVAAALLMFGAIGVYLRQIGGAGWAAATAFGLALIGSALLLATEWTQIFEVRDVALRAPETLNRLDAEGMALDDIGAVIAFSALTVGWISLAVVSHRSGLFPRQSTMLVVAGFFATPFLSAALPPIVAGAIGNTVLGTGWILLGLSLRRRLPRR